MNFLKNFPKILGLIVASACAAVIFLAMSIAKHDPFRTQVAFLDVGQGDAILISCGSNQMLIDTGKNSRALLSELGKLLPLWDKTIEVVLLTHPDQDHVGAFPDLLSRYEVRLLLSANIPDTSDMGRTVREAIAAHNIRRIDPRAGLSIAFSPDMKLEALFPDSAFIPNPKNTNASSVITRLQVGKDSFLFLGDLPKEEFVLSEEDIRVLKVAHHGSKYSTSDAFLERMMPEEAVISVGKNSYGHPAPDVLDRLERRGIRMLRTDTSGTIVYECPITVEASCQLVRPKL